MIERYGVYWVRLDPVQGSEIAKTRLHPHWPFRVQTRANQQAGEIAVDQIRTIDKSRLNGKVDQLEPAVAEEIRHVITQMYGVLSVS